MTSVTKTTSSIASAGRYKVGDAPAQISVKTWALDDAAPTAVLQLNHGMAEYIDRYDAFAREVASLGWLVVGMDFIGHGDSAPTTAELGFTGVALPDGRNVLLEDMHALRVRTQADHPGVPYFMLAHSMGSFVLRGYLGAHGDGLAGAVISGTGTMAAPMIVVARALLGCIGVAHDSAYRSPFFAAMSLGAYNKPFEKAGARTPFDWLSRDDAQVDKYVADPRCGGLFTLAANKVLMDSIARANAPATYAGTRDLPLLLVSGGDDPVGGAGKGVTQVADAYKRAGVRDVTLKLYPQARHELLNELNKAEATADIIGWLGQHVPA